jgi:hypothetical protein
MTTNIMPLGQPETVEVAVVVAVVVDEMVAFSFPGGGSLFFKTGPDVFDDRSVGVVNIGGFVSGRLVTTS